MNDRRENCPVGRWWSWPSMRQEPRNPSFSRAVVAGEKDLGFTVENWVSLAEALRNHALLDSAVLVSESAYGEKYQVTGPVPSPDGRSPDITSIWIIEKSSEKPRLVTAYPS